MSRRKPRSALDQVSEFDRGRIVAYGDCRLSFRQIGSRVGLNQTTVVVVANATCLTYLHAEIVEVEIEVVSPSIVPSGNFAELKLYCHLYGAQGQRQAYLLPMPR
ncbi:hypothetical protein TNCV_4783541 [Trichonephila clavipes]|nr:hypothetical protein TNCV_4783541 [Trichonephila clavipes]